MIERFNLCTPFNLVSCGFAIELRADVLVTGIARLGFSIRGDLCFCVEEPASELRDIASGTMIFTTTDLAAKLQSRFPGVLCVTMSDPRASFIDLGQRLLSDEAVEVSPIIPRPLGVHPSAQIGTNSMIHPETRIDEHVTIGSQCVIHRGAWIKAGAIIRDNTVIGVEGINAYLGQDGRKRGFPHFAGVIIGENAEIGAGVVVVRGILNSTIIRQNSVIGNLSNIGHGVEIGEKVWMSVGCLIGGHTKICDGATLGMGVAVKDNIVIGDCAQVGMASVVIKSIPAKTSVFGNPARKVGPIQAGPLR